MKNQMKQLIKRLVLRETHFVDRSTVEVANLAELKKVFGWQHDGDIGPIEALPYENLCDLNERRVRDAEVLATVCRNLGGGAFLEIGTSFGQGTCLMASNAPGAEIFTVNIDPREVDGKRTSELTDWTPSLDEIGRLHREAGHANVRQLIANTAGWNPELPPLDLVFVDGSHLRKMVVNDAEIAFRFLKKGGFLLFHDFSPPHFRKYDWIKGVILGVEDLYRMGLLNSEILWVRDSWIGVYQHR